MSLDQSGQPEVALALQHTVTPEQEVRFRAHETNSRSARGYVLLGATAAAAGAIWWGSHTDGKITTDAPFSPIAQEVVEAVDGVMADMGAPLAVGALSVLAGAKIAARYYPNIREADKESSGELSDDGSRGKPNFPRRFLQNYAAGTVPVIASGAVAMAGIMSGVGNEISEGPSRPIEYMVDGIPGNGLVSIVVQDASANPMVESKITRDLTGRIQAAAADRGVLATPIDMNLAPMSHNGQKLTTLVFAAEDIAADSPLQHHVATTEACNSIPIAVDRTARINNGEHVRLNGYDAVVVDQIKGASAINRVGIKVAPEVMAVCLDKGKTPVAPPHDIIAIAADTSEAQAILTDANASVHEAAAVVSEGQFIQNSEDFWKANSKPITNVLALMSTGVAMLSVAGSTYARLLRNRRSWATNLGQGVSDSQLRLTELLRATKDGVVASVVGSAVSLAAPAINFLESGLKVGVDYRTVMVGFTVGILGSVGGTLPRIIRPRRVISVSEDTRVL